MRNAALNPAAPDEQDRTVTDEPPSRMPAERTRYSARKGRDATRGKVLWRARWLVIPVSGVIALGVFWLVVVRSPETEDSDVHCLSQQQRQRLVEAAETLGLAGRTGTANHVKIGTQELSLAEWRAQRPHDFERSCLALRPARPAGQSTALMTGLIATVNAVIGALIAYASARYRDSVQRREQHARSLHSAATAFTAAVENYLGAWAEPFRSSPPDATELRSRRRDLTAELSLVSARHPDWPEPREAIERIGAELGDAITQGWDGAGRTARVAELTRISMEISEQVAAITVELERPRRPAAAPCTIDFLAAVNDRLDLWERLRRCARLVGRGHRSHPTRHLAPAPTAANQAR
jgi:hypothetical protein